MFGISVGLGFVGLAFVGALLFMAIKFNTGGKKFKHASMVVSLLAGLALVGSIVGDWVTHVGVVIGGFAAAVFLVLLAVIIIDWLHDKKADKPAVIAMFLLPVFAVMGIASLATVVSQVKDGGSTVGTHISSTVK